MSNKDALYIAHKRLTLKHNIFLLLLLIFVIIIMFLGISVYTFYVKSINRIINYDVDYRRISIIDTSISQKVDVKLINNIPYIVAYYSTKYMGDYYVDEIFLFKEKNHPGEISLEPVITNKDLLTTKGLKLDPKASGYAVCPQEFYPSSEVETGEVNYLRMLKGRDFLGKTFMVDNLTFEVIDTYDSNINIRNKNTCFISFKDYQTLTDRRRPDETEGFILQIDDIQNVETVINYLNEHNVKYEPIFTLLYDEINSIKVISLGVTVISLVVALVVSMMIIFKKNNYNEKYYLLLKSLGYMDSDIKKISMFELVMIFFLSLIIGFILFYIALLVIKYGFLSANLYSTTGFQVEYLLNIIVSLILLLSLILINNKNITKHLKARDE